MRYIRGPLSWGLLWLCEAVFWAGERCQWPFGFFGLYQWAGCKSCDLQGDADGPSWYGPWRNCA